MKGVFKLFGLVPFRGKNSSLDHYNQFMRGLFDNDFPVSWGNGG